MGLRDLNGGRDRRREFNELNQHARLEMPSVVTMQSPNTRIVDSKLDDEPSASLEDTGVPNNRVGRIDRVYLRQRRLIERAQTGCNPSEEVTVQVEWMGAEAGGSQNDSDILARILIRNSHDVALFR